MTQTQSQTYIYVCLSCKRPYSVRSAWPMSNGFGSFTYTCPDCGRILEFVPISNWGSSPATTPDTGEAPQCP